MVNGHRYCILLLCDRWYLAFPGSGYAVYFFPCGMFQMVWGRVGFPPHPFWKIKCKILICTKHQLFIAVCFKGRLGKYMGRQLYEAILNEQRPQQVQEILQKKIIKCSAEYLEGVLCVLAFLKILACCHCWRCDTGQDSPSNSDVPISGVHLYCTT